MKLTQEEKNFINKISAIACYNPAVVREVFKAMLIAVSLKLYSGEKEIIIPHIAKMKIQPEIKPGEGVFEVKEVYDIETSPALHDVVKSIVTGEGSQVKETIINDIGSQVSKILELD